MLRYEDLYDFILVNSGEDEKIMDENICKECFQRQLLQSMLG